MEFQMEKLHTMKRVELQRICKKVGIKANMKTTKLIEALMQHGCIKETQMEKPVDENIRQSLPNNERWTCDSDVGKDTVADKMKTNNKDETITSPHDQDIKTLENKQKGGKKLVTEENKNPSKATSKIPRLSGLRVNKNATTSNCSTPSYIQNKTPKSSRSKDWSKIHQKQFEKMDSLDVYLKKKRKRAEDLGSSNSIKKVKIAVQEEKETKKAEKAQTSFKSSTTPKPQQKKSAIKKVDFRRNTLTCNPHKTFKENAITPGKQERRATFGVTKITTESARKPTTPFRFSTGANTIFSPTPRNAFDLKASLAKPLSYKPYTGKLPNSTYAKNDPKIASVKKINTHKRDVKEVKVTTRKERREQQTKKQSKKRAEGVCKRRGIIS